MTDAPQYRLTLHVNGVLEHEAELADPFVTSTTTIPRADLLRFLEDTSDGDDMVLVTRVGGTRAAYAHVFRPMDAAALALNDEQPRTLEGATEAQA